MPRTFLGAIIIALLTSPISTILLQIYPYLHMLGIHEDNLKMVVFFFARLMLLLCNIGSVYHLANSLSLRFGADVGYSLLIITTTQFHLLFYMSRPLPNTFALILVTLAFSEFVSRRSSRGIIMLTIATVVFRCDIAILCLTMAASLLLYKRVTILEGAAIGVISAISAIALSVLVDSVLWQQGWLWPEGVVLYYNSILNKSSEWGTSPPLWYFYSALPRALLLSLVLIPIGIFPQSASFIITPRHFIAANKTLAFRQRISTVLRQHDIAEIFYPALLFVVIYSILPHKELRFLLPVLPVFNATAAVGLAQWYRRTNKNRYLLAIAIGALICSLLVSMLFLYISSLNYPGGYAIQRLHERYPSKLAINTVHIDVLSAQTGISRFTESLSPYWVYSKTENEVNICIIYIINLYSFHFISIGFRLIIRSIRTY